MRRLPIAALGLALGGAPALAADAFSTDWAAGAKHEARLIAAGGDLAAFEIRLAPGAITDWRDPGDSGLPPTFDFAGSDNVEAVEPLFPAPKRIREADSGQAFGYDGGVVFPLKVKPRDATKPVTLALQADFAVCEKVCLPAKARLTLTLPAAASPYARAIDAALAAVPHVVPPNDFGELSPTGGESWRLCAPHEAGPPRDLFVEPPEGWWLTATPTDAEAGHDCFTIALRLTLTGGAAPVETTVEAAARAP